MRMRMPRRTVKAISISALEQPRCRLAGADFGRVRHYRRHEEGGQTVENAFVHTDIFDRCFRANP